MRIWHRFGDYSRYWIKFLRLIPRHPNLATSAMMVGSPGTGKSYFLFIAMHQLLNYNLDYNVCWWDFDEEQMELIFKHSPEKFHDRTYAENRLREVKPNTAIFVDEAVISVNAKNALRRGHEGSQIWEMAKATHRHKNISLFFNAQTSGTFYQNRSTCKFNFYKPVNVANFANENDEFLFKTIGVKRLLELSPRQTYFKNNAAIRFRDYNDRLSTDENLGTVISDGYLDLDARVHCPWITDELSFAYEGGSFDMLFEKAKRDRLLVLDAALSITEEYPEDDILAGGFSKTVRAHNYGYNYGAYYDLQGKWGLVTTIAQHMIKYPLHKSTRAMLTDIGVDPHYLVTRESETPEIDAESFQEYCYETIRTYDSKAAQVVRLLLEGKSQKAIQSRVAMGSKEMQEIIHDHTDHQAEYSTINEIVRLTNEQRLSERFQPSQLSQLLNNFIAEIDGIGDRIITGFCNYKHANKFYLSQRYHLQDAFLQAEEREQDYYLVFCNPRWKELRIKKISPAEADIIEIRKTESQFNPREAKELLQSLEAAEAPTN